MKLSSLLKKNLEELKINNIIVEEDVYCNTKRFFKSDKYPNLEYIDRLGYWQFLTPIKENMFSQCVFAKYDMIDKVLDEFIDLTTGNGIVDKFYILYSEKESNIINRINEIDVKKESIYLPSTPLPNVLEVARMPLEDNIELFNIFLNSKKYKVISISEGFFQLGLK